MAIKREHSRRFMLALVVVLGATSITQTFSNWRKDQALDAFWDRMTLAEQRVHALTSRQEKTDRTVTELIKQLHHARTQSS